MAIQTRSWMVRVDHHKQFWTIGVKALRKGVVRKRVGLIGEKYNY